MDKVLCKNYRTLAGLLSPGWQIPWKCGDRCQAVGGSGSSRNGSIRALRLGGLIGNVQTRSRDVFNAERR